MKRHCTLIITLALVLSFATGCSFLGDLPFVGGEIDRPSLGGNEMYYPDSQPPIYSGYDLKVIDSIDKLNYYSALRVLGSSFDALGSDGEKIIAPLSDTDEEFPDSDGQDEPTDSSSEPQPGESTDLETGEYYYALSPDDEFVFSKISMFRIELTDKDGFLASKLGVGTVDVVISEGCIWDDSLITFRNGDSFFSCLSNGTGFNQEDGTYYIEFSTHKFISGFYIVKNIVQENYTFTVKFDSEGQALSFTANEFKVGGPRADRDVRVVSETTFSEDYGSFTVKELDEYFSKKNEEKKEEDEPNEA